MFAPAFCIFLACGVAGAQNSGVPRSPVLTAMKAELTRSLATFKTQPTPPYFLSYEVTDDRTFAVNASFGEITLSRKDHQRKLDIDLRVGSPQLDNTHEIRGGMPDLGGFMNRFLMVAMPLDDDPAAIRNVIWYSTDQKYKAAVEQFTKVKTNVEVQAAPDDKSDAPFARHSLALSPEPPSPQPPVA